MKTNTRRNFIKNTLTASLAVAVSSPLAALADTENKGATALKFTQVPLKYAYNALEPNIDALTMEIHYTRHHTAYIKNVNDAIAAENIPYATEQEFFDNASKLSAKARNNGGGAWNHNFFFETLKPGNSAGPQGKLKAAIDKALAHLTNLRSNFQLLRHPVLVQDGPGWSMIREL